VLDDRCDSTQSCQAQTNSFTHAFTGALAFKVTRDANKKDFAQLAEHRDSKNGGGDFRYPQAVAVVTFWFKKDAQRNKYQRVGKGDTSSQNEMASVDFRGAGKSEKFQLPPGDASVYVMAGSANAYFMHKVTCNASSNCDWLRVSVPTFLFW
jgi:hypothetical protein